MRSTSADGAAFVRDVLPAYLMKRRWFSAKDQSIKSVAVQVPRRRCRAERELLLAEIEIAEPTASVNRWLLPLAVVWDDEPAGALPGQLALARVRRGRRTGLLTDAFALAGLRARRCWPRSARRTRLETPEGTIALRADVEASEDALCRPEDADVLWLTRRAVEQLADRRRRRRC